MDRCIDGVSIKNAFKKMHCGTLLSRKCSGAGMVGLCDRLLYHSVPWPCSSVFQHAATLQATSRTWADLGFHEGGC